jgi:hypothetical protein
MHAAAERADLRSGFVGAAQQLLRSERCLFGSVFFFDAATAARLTQMFTQKLTSLRINQPDLPGIPLDLYAPADPSWRAP